MVLSSVVSEVFNVEKCRDLEIRVRRHLRPLKVIPFDRIGMVLKAESTEHKHLAYVIALNEKKSLSNVLYSHNIHLFHWILLRYLSYAQKLINSYLCACAVITDNPVIYHPTVCQVAQMSILL